MTLSPRLREVEGLASEVAEASREQAAGINQMNSAVAQMGRVTQNNAATAEETATSAEELNVQAEAMKATVGGLSKLVSGNSGRDAALDEPPVSTVWAAPRVPKFSAGNGHADPVAPPDRGLNCWEFKQCGREAGGAKARELGVCPAYPDHGHDCARLAGTLCGGKVQGSFANKITSCLKCKFYNSPNYARESLATLVNGNVRHP